MHSGFNISVCKNIFISNDLGTTAINIIKKKIVINIVYSIFFEQLLPSDIKEPSDILQQVYPLGFALIGASILEFLFSLKLISKVGTKHRMKFDPKKYINFT
jgi:hypothetical protein